MTDSPRPDGVYIGLPMEEYVRDSAVGASGIEQLCNNPPDLFWKRWDNPLWKPPEKREFLLGNAMHTALLEGLARYEQTYATPPLREQVEGAVLDTAKDMTSWIRAQNEWLAAADISDQGKPVRLNVSGVKDELARRIREHWDWLTRHGLDDDMPHGAPVFWEDVVAERLRGRQLIDQGADAHVRIIDSVVRLDPTYGKLLSGGIPELSIFWTDDGVRRKARPDYLRPTAIVELKTFGRVSPRGLVRGFLADRVSWGDHVQAVCEYQAVERARDLPIVYVEDGEQGIDRAHRIHAVRQLMRGDKAFVWLGVGVDMGPTLLAVRFDRDDFAWVAAEQRVIVALDRYRDYRGRFGDALWIRSEGLVKPDATDWPSWATEPVVG